LRSSPAPDRGSGTPNDKEECPMNLVALAGRLSRPPEERQLPSGDRMLALDVTVSGPEGRDETAPVVWFNAPAAATDLDVGASVVVVGRVRRRFFRSGGATQSRTEVVADVVLPGGAARQVRRALRNASARLEDLAADPSAPPPAKAAAATT
jgi:single-strand DNA-binding protein